jgi:hypothetical protein
MSRRSMAFRPARTLIDDGPILGAVGKVIRSRGTATKTVDYFLSKTALSQSLGRSPPALRTARLCLGAHVQSCGLDG